MKRIKNSFKHWKSKFKPQLLLDPNLTYPPAYSSVLLVIDLGYFLRNAKSKIQAQSKANKVIWASCIQLDLATVLPKLKYSK